MKTIEFLRDIYSTAYQPELLHKKGDKHKTYVHRLDNSEGFLIVRNRISPNVNGLILTLKDFKIEK